MFQVSAADTHWCHVQIGKEAGEMLKRNTGLVSLDLRNNRLGKGGLLAIAEGVQVCLILS